MTLELAEFLLCDEVSNELIIEHLGEVLGLDRSAISTLDELWPLLPSDRRLLAVAFSRGKKGYRVLVKLYSNFEFSDLGGMAKSFAVRFATAVAISNCDQPLPDLVYIYKRDGGMAHGVDVSTADTHAFLEVPNGSLGDI